jgi:8-oxo-dGTP pyrophosphatase MutT (NUDIX family)
MNKPKYIEIVGGAIIENPKNEILLVKSPKWRDKWVMPGGHIEFGETIEEGTKREAEEEVGLKNLISLGIIHYGELINSKEFRTNDTNIVLDKKELTEYLWINPEKALEMDLGESHDRTVKAYINLVKS